MKVISEKMKKDLSVAVLQTYVPKSKNEGERQIIRLVKKVMENFVDMVGLSEDCLATMKEIKEGYKPLDFLSRIAKENNIYLFGATLVERNGDIYNLGFLFNKKGELIAEHKKIVLTPPEEMDGIVAGNTLRVFDTEFGKMSILVCKDSFHRYAAWFFDKLKKAGVDIVLIPSYSLNVSQRSVELWVDSLKALAKWFDVYIIAPGTIGGNATDYPSFGHSLIICPKRVVLAEGSFDKEEVLRAKLDTKSISEIRETYGSKWQPKDVPEVIVIS